MRFPIPALVILLFASLNASAQPEKRWIKHKIGILSGPSMHGRGYVNKGVEKAANYLRRQFREYGVLPFDADSSYMQSFSFPVNTFPRAAMLQLGKKLMVPGEDFIVNAGSTGYQTDKLKVKTLNLKEVKDTLAWQEILKEIRHDKAYLLRNYDTVTKYLKYTNRAFAGQLPRGLFLVPKHGKLTWTVATDTIPATIFYVEDTVMPRRVRKVAAALENKFIPNFRSHNVLGLVPLP